MAVIFLCGIFLLPFILAIFFGNIIPRIECYKEEGTGYLIPVGTRRPYYEPDYEDRDGDGSDEHRNIMISYSDYDDNENIFRVVPAWHHGEEIQTISDCHYWAEELSEIFRIDPAYELVDKEYIKNYLECTWRKKV